MLKLDHEKCTALGEIRGLSIAVARGVPCQPAVDEDPGDRRDPYMFDQEIWMDLRALHRQGWSLSALAREFDLNRRTVRRYAPRRRSLPMRRASAPQI